MQRRRKRFGIPGTLNGHCPKYFCVAPLKVFRLKYPTLSAGKQKFLFVAVEPKLGN
jgi:hypothetical protein